MKFENNWRYKTLENLEKEFWGEATYDSHLVKRCHELRKVTLDKFTIEDLRIMIGQQIGLFYLIPLAIEELRKNIFAEGDFFPGDLLKNVLSIDSRFWKENKNLWKELNELIKDHRKQIDSNEISTTSFDRVFQ